MQWRKEIAELFLGPSAIGVQAKAPPASSKLPPERSAAFKARFSLSLAAALALGACAASPATAPYGYARPYAAYPYGSYNDLWFGPPVGFFGRIGPRFHHHGFHGGFGHHGFGHHGFHGR
jgi:hypothetical protein